MEKLYKYFEKLGIVETQKYQRRNYIPDIEYYRVQYGDDYFYNAPNYHYSAALVCFDYNRSGECADYFRHLKDIENKIEKYARRYGYEIFNKALHPWEVSFVIARRDDREKAGSFFKYRDAAIEAVNQAIHKSAVEHYDISNDDIKAIMNEYGNYYNEFLKTSA